ncbi:hypothetical protein [Alteromonas sp. CYL-A6]|uniref:hypothetical protein n=1 Tax=Alteromonas nitratireducens TaxID=3390813 RepID=UPI0034AAC90F
MTGSELGIPMSDKSIPELLRRSLQSHMEASDLHDDEELQALLGKLNDLSGKVAAAKAKVLARRQLSKTSGSR